MIKNIAEAIEVLSQINKNYDSLVKENEELKYHIKNLQTMDISWMNPDTLNLKQAQYSREKIKTAFLKAKKYEGLKTNEFTTVLDTFIKFLEED